MDNSLTYVALIVDRSGSMSGCQMEAQNGINHFIEEQKKTVGKCLFSLIQFDSEYEFVYKNSDITTVKEFVLVPRGTTALLDTVGMTINDMGEHLMAMSEDDRPGLVVVVIVTDGHENSSHEFKKDQIKEMIDRQRDEYNWQFTFLGANQDAFAEAAGLGIPISAAASYTPTSADLAFAGASSNVCRMRMSAASGQCVHNVYTDDEQEAME